MMVMGSSILVIGGGAAGMMAAAAAASRGMDTTVFEKNDKLGKKIYITGKGRCNVTNQCDIEEFINSTPGNGSFLYSALHFFDNNKLRDILMQMGVPTKVERGNRVFPVSDKSSDVIKALASYMKKYNVSVRLGNGIADIAADEGGVKGVYTTGGEFVRASSVVVATGGLSYPSTGSTGDGLKWAKKLGHTVVTPRPSLVPMETREKWVKDLQGLALRNVKVTAINYKSDKIRSEFGEMLFTHFGVSGPVILTLSRFVIDSMENGIRLIIDTKPALSNEKLDRRMIRDFMENANKRAKYSLDTLLPKSLAAYVFDLSGINPDKPVHQISKDERHALAKLLKSITVNITGLRPFSEAVITAGGVSTKEIDPTTMESRICKGLYFAGEVLDVDALTGGFNLQIAFSTGYAAGMHCK
jgi:hypothetical protein